MLARLESLILIWFVTALALWIVARVVRGIEVRHFGDALLATIVIAMLDAVIRPVLRVALFPLNLITFGALALVIANALSLMLASLVLTGFKVRGFLNVLTASLVLTVLTFLLRFAAGVLLMHSLWRPWS
jgi:putative membrane protein